MADVPTGSFIPKRSVNQARRTKRYNFFIFGIISYALFIAAPVASAAVFVYEKYTEKSLNAAIAELDKAVNDFSVSDLQMVVGFDNQLEGANYLLGSHISLVSAMNILEQSTAETVAFEDLSFERSDRSTLAVNATLSAEDFDAAIFQRETYSENDLIASSSMEDLTFTPPSDETDPDTPQISVAGVFNFNADNILYTPAFGSVITPVSDTDTSDTTTEATGDEANPPTL